MNNDNYITKCECDTCGKTTLCVLFHCNGTPVLGQCRVCDPRSFEAQARQEIDAWLAGRRFQLLCLDYINCRIDGSYAERVAA